MRVLVIGGNGRTGRLVVDEALRRGTVPTLHSPAIAFSDGSVGHEVTALVRNPESLEARKGLTVVKGKTTYLSNRCETSVDMTRRHASQDTGHRSRNAKHTTE